MSPSISEIKRLIKQRVPLARRLMIAVKFGRSETSKCRHSLARFCTGDGIDIGYGGDPIVPHAICMDMAHRYADYRQRPQHLHGDARALTWFRDEALDFVYSSHVLEDFEDTGAVLGEWLRILKPGGHLVLYLPDEPTYRAHCEKAGQRYNEHHVHADFGVDLVKRHLLATPSIEIVHERFPVGIYSFELVARKGGELATRLHAESS